MTKAGRIFAVVGPSGAGKDTLIDAVRARLPDLHVVRRAITRPEALGGEPFEGVSDAEFDQRLATGGFALFWSAHGLRYGIPADVHDRLACGQTVVFNGSRAMIDAARAVFPDITVLLVTASPETLANRLAKRGRETEEEIRARLERATTAHIEGPDVIRIDNDGTLDDAVAALLEHLQPESA